MAKKEDALCLATDTENAVFGPSGLRGTRDTNHACAPKRFSAQARTRIYGSKKFVGGFKY